MNYPENMCVMGYICSALQKCVTSFCLCRLPVMCTTFWFNAYSIIKLFSFSTTFMERFSGLGEDFVFNHITQTMYIDISLFVQDRSYNREGNVF